MVVVGGSGFFFGPLLGAAVVILLPEVLRFTEGYYLIIYAAARHRADGIVPERADWAGPKDLGQSSGPKHEVAARRRERESS